MVVSSRENDSMGGCFLESKGGRPRGVSERHREGSATVAAVQSREIAPEQAGRQGWRPGHGPRSAQIFDQSFLPAKLDEP